MNLLELSSAESSTFEQPKGLGDVLWAHQRAALEYIVRQRRVLIGDEVGVGKTAVALAAIQALSAFPTLITPPAYLRYKWLRDTHHWLPGVSVRMVEPGEPLLLPGGIEDPDIFIISYNLLRQHLKTLLTLPIRGVIADEGHFLKNAKAQRTKAFSKAALNVPLRLILGATPVEKGPRDLVSQLAIIDQMGPFISGWRFLQRYCNKWGEDVRSPSKFQMWDFSGGRNLDELNTKLRSSCYVRREKTQVHKSLPPLTLARVDLEISNKTEYALAESDFLGWLRNVDPERALTAAKAEALTRVGHLKRLAAEGKRAAAMEWFNGFIEENPEQKLVVFTYLRASADYFCKEYGAPGIVGGVPMDRRDRIIHDFQNQPWSRLLFLSVEAGGVGIDLFAASNCVFYELDWVPTTHTQAAGRLHRPGQTSPVTAWYMIGRGTVEERIFELLAARERVVAATTQGAAPGAPSPGDATGAAPAPAPDVLASLLDSFRGSSKPLRTQE